MNVVTMVGRLSKDVELRFTQSGKAVGNFTLAVNREYAREGEPKADFFPIVVWGRQAETCNEYISKGYLVGVRGRLQVRSFDGKDGSKRYVTEIVADNVSFLAAAKSSVGAAVSAAMSEEVAAAEIPL